MSAIGGTALASGTVLTGKVSWFGGPNDPTSGPTTASGSPISAGGIAVYNSATLGGYWQLTFPNGKTVVEKQTDLGPAPWTGRTFDVAYSSLAGAGYTESDFPTNGVVKGVYLGKTAPAGGISASTPKSSTAGSSGSSSTSTSTSVTPEGLEGTLVKAMLYLALILGGIGLAFFGSRAALKPVKGTSS